MKTARTSASRDTKVVKEGNPGDGSKGRRTEASRISNAGASERREKKRKGRSLIVVETRLPPPRQATQ